MLMLAAPGAAAAEDSSRTDPEIGSPAEAVYGIPLEEARRDAAPGVLPEATVRTENSVGSSSRVPGRGAAQAGDDPDAEDGDDRRRKRDRKAARAATRLSGETSPVATLSMLVLLVAIAAAGGVGAGRLVGSRARL